MQQFINNMIDLTVIRYNCEGGGISKDLAHLLRLPSHCNKSRLCVYKHASLLMPLRGDSISETETRGRVDGTDI